MPTMKNDRNEDEMLEYTYQFGQEEEVQQLCQEQKSDFTKDRGIIILGRLQSIVNAESCL